MNKVFILVLSFLFAGCRSPIDIGHIKEHSWKYGNGDGWAGDWISFDRGSSYKLNHDTLFIMDTAKAIILSLEKNGPYDHKMKLKIIESGKTGTYHQK